MLESREGSAEEVALYGLKHRIYIPQGGAAGRPVVFLVHGRAGNSSVMWVFSKAIEKLRPVVIAPEATWEDPRGGYSWWPVYDQPASGQTPEVQRERLRELETGVLLVRDLVERVHSTLGTDRGKSFGFGFSQGGALVGTLSLMQPGIFCGVAILSGFLPYAAREISGILDPAVHSRSAALGRYFVSHGSKDPILPFSRALDTKDWLESHGAEVTFYEDDSTHKVGAGGIKALGSWFEGFFAP